MDLDLTWVRVMRDTLSLAPNVVLAYTGELCVPPIAPRASEPLGEISLEPLLFPTVLIPEGQS